MKKGFTLVELLGTITILGVIVLIAFPIAKNIINDSKEELYEVQISNISDALKNWSSDNSRLLPENQGETITITLGQLKAGGYIDSEIKNPINNKCFGNDMLLTVTRHQKNYIYNVIEETNTETDSCDNYLKPYIILNGDAIVYVEVGSQYEELGASAVGIDGTPISDNIIVSMDGTIDTSVVGNSYTITYTITEGGTTTSINRKVIVNDTIPPELTIPDNIVLEDIEENFDIMEGVTATDNSGETVNIIAKSNIAFGISGEYIVTYTATDTSGNKTTKKRVVNIKKAYGNSIFSSDDKCVLKGNNCEPGTLVEVYVNDSTKYNFYVINDDANELTLIMDRNLVGRTEWLTQEDYEKTEGGTWQANAATAGNNDKGPITLLNTLNDLTSNWTNIPAYDYILNDDKPDYYSSTIKYSNVEVKNARARLLTYTEAANLGCTINNDTCPLFLVDNTVATGDWSSYGYWFSTAYMQPFRAWYLIYSRKVTATEFNGNAGLRPVITLLK